MSRESVVLSTPKASAASFTLSPRGLQAVVSNGETWVRWVLHRHGGSSVIISEIQVKHIAVLEAEDHTPVSTHIDHPETTQTPLERV